ncbi:hypothetical protein MLD38_004666 [Melastoma candidum]|uniref:Uncharacterized protein n=1 Tax=Melastoma candidum TaxID=119954 RepID=A0ACB9S7R1_9MYRT|nr:hypothetical protein MLD38_004666 [Melastoma candidum]
MPVEKATDKLNSADASVGISRCRISAPDLLLAWQSFGPLWHNYWFYHCKGNFILPPSSKWYFALYFMMFIV